MSLPPTLSSAPAGAASLPAAELRIVTYNVHSCIGTDRRLDPARIADVLASLEPDVVALQELDVGRRRTGGIDQAFAIAEAMKMASHFHPALLVREEKYGDAILTSLPSRLVKAGPLPSVGEPRGALWLEVMVGEQPVHIFNTHFGLRRTERIRQAEALTGPDWIGAAQQIGGPIVLAGISTPFPPRPAIAVWRQPSARSRSKTGGCLRRPFRPASRSSGSTISSCRRGDGCLRRPGSHAADGPGVGPSAAAGAAAPYHRNHPAPGR